MCEKPYMVGINPCPCQKCLPCLINRRRLWTARLILESYKHEKSCFVTLTYDEEHIPKGGSLDPTDVQKWLKRVRKILAPQKIRYYLAGEYGEKGSRPHYHILLFGVDSIDMGGDDGRSGIAGDSWKKGYVYVGELTPESAAYVAGYITKKLEKIEDGRHPIFSRMSLRPGIGSGAMEDVARVLEDDFGSDEIVRIGDVPYTLKRAMRGLPIARYLRGKLREYVGFSSKDVPEEAKKKFAEEMRSLLQEAFIERENHNKSVGKILVDMNAQKMRNLVARFKLKNRRSYEKV